MCLKQAKQQVCAARLFSLMSSAAGEWEGTELGLVRNIAAFFPSCLCKSILCLLPPLRTGEVWSLGRYYQGWKAGWAEEEVLERCCQGWKDDRAEEEALEWGLGLCRKALSGGEGWCDAGAAGSVPGCLRLPCGTRSAARGLLLVLFFSSFPGSELCAAPSLARTWPARLSHILGSVSLSPSARQIQSTPLT